MQLLRGMRIPALHGFATVLPIVDFETYSEAGYEWEDVPGYWKAPGKNAHPMAPAVWVPPTKKLTSLEGIANTNRGLRAVGAAAYIQHSTFEVISLAYDLYDGTGPRSWRPYMSPPNDLFEWVARYREGQPYECIEGLVEGWNSDDFEFMVWSEFCAPKLGWPPLHTEQVRDAMAKSARAKYPRKLAAAGEVLKLTIRKDPEGERLIHKLTVPRNPTKSNPATRWTEATAPDEFAKFYAYNVTDIMSEAEASRRLPDLSPRELEICKVSARINQRGMPIDRKGVNDCIGIVEQAVEKYNGELRAITNGAVNGSSEVQKTLEWLKTQGYYLPNLDEETVEYHLSLNLESAVHRVLQIRQRLAFGSVKKLYAMRAQTCADGRLRGQYAYAAAHTDLWNGQGVQVANLYKGKLDKPEKVERALAVIASGSLEYVEGVYGDALECVADCLRSMIVASPGHRLIASDFNAIQAVVTAALAGERWRMEVFRTHGKIYESCASLITGKPLQFYIDYKKQYNKHHDDRQPYGKIAELSSGFGGWVNAWKKFGAGEFMTDDEIKAAILKWRAASPMIVELWGGQVRNKFNKDVYGRWAPEYPELYGLEGMAIRAVLEPGQWHGYRGIWYGVWNDVLYCQPPGNCDPLIYHEPRVERAKRDYARAWELDLTYMGWNSNQTKGQGGWVRMPLYGGVCTQNVVAKVHREFQADTLVRLERSGLYLPVMHTHDENVTEVADGVGNIDEYLGLVNQPREGCSDELGPWPIKAPGADETQRYGKWE